MAKPDLQKHSCQYVDTYLKSKNIALLNAYKNDINLKTNKTPETMRIGIVKSFFNQEVCFELCKACIDELLKLNILAKNIFVVEVPGALEIPMMLNRMAYSGQFDGLVALGAVIRGDTYHFDIVANESARGISQVAIDHQIAVANAVLTTEDDGQAFSRADEKARAAANVVVEMAELNFALPEFITD